MSFDSAESSAESSSPREGVEIQHGQTRYRIATGSQDITLNGNVFTAGVARRGVLVIDPADHGSDLEIELPVAHPFVQRYVASPPKPPTVAIYRANDGETRRVWTGVITGVRIESHLAKFPCVSQSTDTLKRRLPTVTVSRLCPHVLYDSNCKVARTVPFRTVSTVVSYGGKYVTVASIGAFTDNFAKFGELLHIPSGERTPIIGQLGTILTLQRPIYELRDGDAVHVFAGCDHTVATCASKFTNVVNFGGAPQLPAGNIFIGGGFGIYTSEPDE